MILNKFKIFTIALLLGIGDAVTTIYAIKNGLGYESIAIAAKFQDMIGLVPAAILTIFYFIGLVMLAVFVVEKTKDRGIKNFFNWFIILFLITKAYVVISNYIIIHPHL